MGEGMIVYDVWANDFEVVATYDENEFDRAKSHAARIGGYVADAQGEVIWEESHIHDHGRKKA